MRDFSSRSDTWSSGSPPLREPAGPAAEGRIGGRAKVPSAWPIVWWMLFADAFADRVMHTENDTVFWIALALQLIGYFFAVLRVGAISKARVG